LSYNVSVVAQIPAPAPQEKRLAAYLEWLAQAAGHADRALPLRNYCTGLLLDGERKSVEPMAARLAPDHVQRMHESLHHFVAQSPWSDADVASAELRLAGDAESGTGHGMGCG